MRIMEIEGCEKAKLEYSKFCAENELPDCFGTICYFMDTQGLHLGVNASRESVFSSGYICTDGIRIHKKGGFVNRASAEFFIAQEAFNYVEFKGLKPW
jgi:hypothetical protein